MTPRVPIKTLQTAYRELMRCLRALNTDDDAHFYVGLSQKPVQEVLHIYILASGRIVGRANIAAWLTEQPPMMRLDQTVHEHKYWCGPAMKRIETRTEEVRICGECKEDVTRDERYHWLTCPRCLNVVCRNLKTVFSVEVSESAPRGFPRESGLTPGHSSGRIKEFEWRGNYCGDCADHVRTILTAAGLVKRPVETPNGITLDTSS